MKIRFQDYEVKLTELHQFYTYEGLLEGFPTDRLNEKILRELVTKATGLTLMENHYLVKPKQEIIEIDRSYSFGNPMSLPSVTCILGLKYSGTSNPNMGGISELTFICFQEDFGLPLSDEVLEHISTLKWFSLAKDISWEEF